ncbi:hypothetical protein [Ornithinimicrobium pekingense]|uniref:Uncharacterized protein n=1 Tax=Ornithinimicrobium pekingense TaxID=384677 RepID=A0ABQ2F423_9MICO|nr:hypothetical protein [Ornithinimicrobium pekingense]GGK57168.1 hypothetical protein GCM10011509_01960 [Ornithinimicrobium pekingense]
MYQHLDLMAAQSMAREREHGLRAAQRHQDPLLRQQEASARHAPPAVDEEHHWFHDLLVRVHLAHAPIH